MALRGPTPSAVTEPAGFAAACRALRDLAPRAEVALSETGAPQRLAPHALALTADVVVDGQELATGRLVVLHDPAGVDAWRGDTRLVLYAKADCEPEMAGDPLLPAVAWSWLEEALAAHDAPAAALAGTVTRVASESFGALAGSERAASAEVELRASWTPPDLDLVRHALAWVELLTTAAGLLPIPPGVAALPRRR